MGFDYFLPFLLFNCDLLGYFIQLYRCYFGYSSQGIAILLGFIHLRMGYVTIWSYLVVGDYEEVFLANKKNGVQSFIYVDNRAIKIVIDRLLDLE